jgi:hypothetical protein
MRLMTLALAAIVGTCGPVCAHDVQVPFVGCKSDGQTGAMVSPKDDGSASKLPQELASRLAWFASNNTGGVLAPRGWHCLELYGSDGSVFMVKPSAFGRDPFSTQLVGPAIQVSISFGQTSGRFEAAKIAARLFPSRKKFVESVMSEGVAQATDFVTGPFPYDRIRHVNRNYVEFETPPNTVGIGTLSRLIPSNDPIRGLVWMDADNDATLLAVRLAPNQIVLADPIVNSMKPH